MTDANVIVVLNSGDPRSRMFFLYVAPVLEMLGADYQTLDCKSGAVVPGDLSQLRLWIVGHPGALHGASTLADIMLTTAVACGAGVVYVGGQQSSAPSTTTASDEVRVLACDHFITAEMEPGQKVRLKKPIAISADLASVPPLSGEWDVLVDLGTGPLLCAQRSGGARFICWSTFEWIDSSVLGPLTELDSLLWRSLVWAARKPFALRSFSRTVSMRVDDCIGETGHYQGYPLCWVDIVNRHGFKPWLGLFAGEMSDSTVRKLGELVFAGKATAQFHGRYLYGTVYRTDAPRELIEKDRQLFLKILGKDLPLSRYLVPHAYDLRSDVLPLVKELGADTIGIAYPCDGGGGADRSDNHWLRCGPFRRQMEGTDGIPWDGGRDHPSVVYLDFLPDGHAAEGIFVYLVEARAVNGYEWFNYADKEPSEPEQAVRNAIDIVTLSFEARLPAALFTHEDSWRGKFLANIPPHMLERIFSTLACCLERYAPRYVTMDEVCGEARERTQFRVCSANSHSGRLEVALAGRSAGSASVTVFEESDGLIFERTLGVPSFESSITMVAPRIPQSNIGSIFGSLGPPEIRQTQVPLMLGSRFSVQGCAWAETMRFFKPGNNRGIHIAQLYDLSSGVCLDEWHHETSDQGWIEIPLERSFILSTGHEYLVAVSTNVEGRDDYPVCPWYFWRPVLSGPLRAPRKGGEQWRVSDGHAQGTRQHEGYFRDLVVRYAAAN